MNIYIFNFKAGDYSGGCAAVVAPSEKKAWELLSKAAHYRMGCWSIVDHFRLAKSRYPRKSTVVNFYNWEE